MFQVLVDERKFYEHELYNPFAGENDQLYYVFIPPYWDVYCSTDRDPTSQIRDHVANIYLLLHPISYTRMYEWFPFNRIPVTIMSYPSRYLEEEMVAVGMNARIRMFEIIRKHLCRQWLARVRVELNRSLSEDVLDLLTAQLEAWFATVPHEDVRFSQVDSRGRYASS